MLILSILLAAGPPTAAVALQVENPFAQGATRPKRAARRRTHTPRTAARSPSGGNVYYANCSAARAAGAAPVMRGAPGYNRKLDRDNDGVGCE